MNTFCFISQRTVRHYHHNHQRRVVLKNYFEIFHIPADPRTGRALRNYNVTYIYIDIYFLL